VQGAGTLHHLGRCKLETIAKLSDRWQLGATVERPLGSTQNDTTAERFKATVVKLDRRAQRLLDCFTQAPTGRVI
jgi:hypothetical protein